MKNNLFFKKSFLSGIILFAISLFLYGCAKKDELTLMLPEKLIDKKETALSSNVRIEPAEHQKFAVIKTPRPPIPFVEQKTTEVVPNLKGDPIDISLSGIPLPSFIKIVFGDYLKVDFDIADDVAARTELITFRTAEKKTPKELYSLAKQVLSSYGVAIVIENRLFHFIGDKGREGQIPLILRTRSTIDVPEDLRPIIQVIDVHSIDKKEMKKYLDQAFPSKAGNITVDEGGNAIIVYGTQETIRGVIEAVRMFDRPSFAGRKSVRVNLTYLTAENISGKLLDILQTEGYFVSDDPTKKTAITILPVPSLNSLIVFAADSTMISHVISWIKELDVATLTDPNGNFYYIAIRNTEAKEIGEVINQVLAKQSLTSLTQTSASRNRRQQQRPQPGKGPVPNRPQPNNRLGGKIVVDEERNGLIFYGTAEEFAQVKPLIEQMDIPARQVLIEVTIAEFTHDLEDQRGFEGFLKKSLEATTSTGFTGKMFFSRAGATIYGGANATGTGLQDGGFNFTVIDDNNVKRAVFNLLAKNTRTTILSNPRLLTRSGGEAKFDIAQRVPTLKARSEPVSGSATAAGDSLLVQPIEYQKAGVILKITPTVRAGRRVDIDVEQEVSDITSTVTGKIESPTFSETKVSTKLSLSDGNSVLMAGFIKNQKSRTRTGFPILMDLPGVGPLFRTDNDRDNKREIILIITPYIVDTDQEATDVTNAFKTRLDWLEH